MDKSITYHGSKEDEFLITFAGKGKNFFTLSEASVFWGSAHNTKIAIHRLIKKGWLKQIEKGKYLIVPLEAGKERDWSEDPYIIGAELVQPSAVAYWSAIRHWNWTEQIPRIIYLQTTKRKSNLLPKVFGVQYEIVTVNERKYFGHVKEWRSGKPVLITDKEKTLIDCADDVERAGSIEELSKAVKAAASEISWQKLNDYIKRFPNRSVMKRLGFLFETLIPNLPKEANKVLDEWQQQMSAGVVPLQSSGRKTGKIITRWRILVNAEVH
jgi:predicted transcriptional regulator of viral defense system